MIPVLAVGGPDAIAAFSDTLLRNAHNGLRVRAACVVSTPSDAGVTGDDAATVTDLDERLADLDMALAVRQALVRLPSGCADILDRFFCRDHSYRTISAELDLPAGTIASRISRCLDRLRKEIGGRDPAPAASGGM